MPSIDTSLALSYLSAAVIALSVIGTAVLGAYAVVTAFRLVTSSFSEWREDREYKSFHDKYLHASDDDIVSDYQAGILTKDQFEHAFFIQQEGFNLDREASNESFLAEEAIQDRRNELIAITASDYFSGKINSDQFDANLDRIHSGKEDGDSFLSSMKDFFSSNKEDRW